MLLYVGRLTEELVARVWSESGAFPDEKSQIGNRSLGEQNTTWLFVFDGNNHETRPSRIYVILFTHEDIGSLTFY